MRNFNLIASISLAFCLVGCTFDDGGPHGLDQLPHVVNCDNVQAFEMTSSYGSAEVRMNSVHYEDGGSYSPTMVYIVEQGETVYVHYCYGRGNVVYNFEVTPTGPPRIPSYDAEVELWFGPVQFADLDLSWGGMLQDTGPTVGVSSMTNNGESEYFTVAVRFSQL